MVHSDDRLASAITMGRQKPLSHRQASCILPNGSFRSQRNLTGSQPASINFCRAPQKPYTPCETDVICSATRLRARFGDVTCNGSLTDHVVRVSLDPDVL